MAPAWNNLKLRGQARIDRARILLSENSLGEPYAAPVIVAHGAHPGPVLGVTATVHGNEVNGIPVIHRLIRSLKLSTLSGKIVAVPVVNLPGFQENIREFVDDRDLNRHMPGKTNGTPAEMYNHLFIKRVIRHLDFLIDLHTASTGRINSLYIRANLKNPVTRRMAAKMRAQIVVHNDGVDGSLRYACAERGIPAITVEVGNPLVIQNKLVDISLLGIQNVMHVLGLIKSKPRQPKIYDTVYCHRSYWMYASRGGVIEVLPGITEKVKKGQTIARIFNLFGEQVEEYQAPEDGVIVGKSTNPICHSGSRILHLGVEGEV